MAALDHSIGDGCGEQGFNGPQKGHGEGRSHKAPQFKKRKGRPGRPRKAGGNGSETGSDGFHGQVKQVDEGSDDQDRDDRPGNFLEKTDGSPVDRPRPEDDNSKGKKGECKSRGIRCGKGFKVNFPFLKEVAREVSSFQTQEILNLRGKDDDGDPGGESHRQGIRDEFDDGPKTEKPNPDEAESGHQGA